MSVTLFRPLLAATLVLAALALPARALELKSFKDALFAYPAILSESDGGLLRVVDYNEMRDINGRDQIPERRVKSEYVSTGVRNTTMSGPAMATRSPASLRETHGTQPP